VSWSDPRCLRLHRPNESGSMRISAARNGACQDFSGTSHAARSGPRSPLDLRRGRVAGAPAQRRIRRRAGPLLLHPAPGILVESAYDAGVPRLRIFEDPFDPAGANNGARASRRASSAPASLPNKHCCRRTCARVPATSSSSLGRQSKARQHLFSTASVRLASEREITPRRQVAVDHGQDAPSRLRARESGATRAASWTRTHRFCRTARSMTEESESAIRQAINPWWLGVSAIGSTLLSEDRDESRGKQSRCNARLISGIIPTSTHCQLGPSCV
jgi:hypothetical protein